MTVRRKDLFTWVSFAAVAFRDGVYLCSMISRIGSVLFLSCKQLIIH
jgi:hypothetical protein